MADCNMRTTGIVYFKVFLPTTECWLYRNDEKCAGLNVLIKVTMNIKPSGKKATRLVLLGNILYPKIITESHYINECQWFSATIFSQSNGFSAEK